MTSLQERSGVYKAFRPFMIGGASAMSATCCIQPIDMVKVRIQLMGQGGGAVNTNPFSVAMQLVKNEGPLTFYKGLSAALFRQFTYGMTRLGIFRTLTDKFTKPGESVADLPFTVKLGCSLTAGGVGALVGTPAEVALIRMQYDTTLPAAERRGYSNVFDALLKIARAEGVNGFFAGALPTVVRGLSINVGMLTTYDSFKKWNSSWLGDGTQSNRFFSGALSGWTAATVSLPFDFVKTRLQKQKPDATGKLPYSGFVNCIATVAKQEGPMAFYNGYFTYVVRITPHIMLTWVFMDNLKALLGRNNM